MFDIVLVDDKDSSKVLKRLLEKNGLSVLPTSSADEACQFVVEHQIKHIIISTRASGNTKKLTQLEIPFSVISGSWCQKAKNLMEDGGTIFLQKPIRCEQIRRNLLPKIK